MRVLQTLRTGAILVILSSAVWTPGAQAQELKAEVIHWWTSGGESAAVKVFADKFQAAGGTWIDTAIAIGENARAAGLNRIVGGNPPTAMQFNTGKQFDEIVANNFVRNLDDIAAAGKWSEILPPAVLNMITRDGHIYAVPVNIHGESWLWYNTKVFADAGLEPPKTWAELLTLGPKLEAAGVIPLALGGQPWQERLTFNGLLLGEGGPELYRTVLSGEDPEVVQTPEFRKVAEMFGELRKLVDPNSPGRNWNDATSMVITGQAAMQMMGDWAKGEFIAAGLTPGKEYGCTIIGESSGYIMGGDVFVFPNVEDPDQQAAQVKLAELMLAPETQIDFNMKKGSVPVRLDVDVSGMDICAQAGMAALRDPAKQIESINMLASPDLVGAVEDVITEFWNTPDMPIDTFIENYQGAIETAG
jgi:glucose/mannose transport system substrate-binding protein